MSCHVVCTVCDVLSRGVFALVAITNRSLAQSVLHSHLVTFHMPLLTTDPTPLSPPYTDDVTSLTLRVWPRVDEAVSDVIVHYNWHHFFFLYDSVTGW